MSGLMYNLKFVVIYTRNHHLENRFLKADLGSPTCVSLCMHMTIKIDVIAGDRFSSGVHVTIFSSFFHQQMS